MSAAEQLAREYELVYILRPTTGPSEAKKVSKRITDVLDKHGAKLTRVDNWGKRKLAFAIEKHTRGIFVYVKFAAYGNLVAELERNLRIVDPVIRYQTVRLDTLYDLSELAVDPAEVEFRDIEEGEDEDEEPTFEERLGMAPPPQRERAEEETTEEKPEEAKSDEAKSDEEKSDEGEESSDDEGEASSNDEESDEGEKASDDGNEEEE